MDSLFCSIFFVFLLNYFIFGITVTGVSITIHSELEDGDDSVKSSLLLKNISDASHKNAGRILNSLSPNKGQKPVTGSRNSKLPSFQFSVVNVSETNSESVKEDLEKHHHHETVYVDSKPALIKSESNKVDNLSPINANKTHKNENMVVEKQESGNSTKAQPLHGQKQNQDVKDSLASLLEDTEPENEHYPIILKPSIPLRKSVLQEILERTCLHCMNYHGQTSGRQLTSNSNSLSEFADFVPELKDTPIELTSRALWKRRLNYQRISSLLPGHRSTPTLEQFLPPSNGKSGLTLTSNINHEELNKSARSFWSEWFSFWPFAKKQQQLQQNSGRIETASLTKSKPIVDSGANEDIILRPILKSFPSFISKLPSANPKLSHITFPISTSNNVNNANGQTTMDEIHDELNKLNTVKLQPVNFNGESYSSSGSNINGDEDSLNDDSISVDTDSLDFGKENEKIVSKTANNDLFGDRSKFSSEIPSNDLPEPRYRHRSLPTLTPGSTVSTAEQQSLAQLIPTPLTLIKCPL